FAPLLKKPRASPAALVSHPRSLPPATSDRRSAGRNIPGGGWDFSKIPLHAPNAPRGQPREKPGERPGVRVPTDKPAAKSPPSPSATIASKTVASGPGAPTRTTIGVGEQVSLTYSAGKIHWATSAGTLSADYD